MATPEERINKIMKNLSDPDIEKIIDFAEFIESKKQGLFDKAFKNVQEVDEPLTDEELESIKKSKQSGSVSYEEMWSKYDL
ncbi:MAG: hypothetical protein V2B14_01045 [bacterium]